MTSGRPETKTMRNRRNAKMALAAVAHVAFCFSLVYAQGPAAPRGMTYESLKDLPQLSGMWVARLGDGRGRGVPGGGRGAAGSGRQGGPPNADQIAADIPPLKDQKVLARFKEAIGLLVSGADNVELAAKYGDVLGGRGGGGGAWRNLGGGMCDPNGGASGFSGRTGGGPESVMEILLTPGRVTITTDHGLIRRIYTDGRPTPPDPFITLTGTSIGRWEGDVLIVETVGLNPKTMLAGVSAGAGFKIDERMYLDSGDALHIDGTITAPEALTGAYKYTQAYVRFQDKNYSLGQFVTDCDKEDRSIDRKTNKQRFDLTPPADLPPPPKDQ
jgi:hypothetical protein